MPNASYEIYSIKTIVYLIISIGLTIAGLILIKKFVKKEATLKWIVKGSGIVLLIFIIINRIATAYMLIVEEAGKHPDITSWWYLIPETFCGLSALTLALDVVFFKKNNLAMHALCYFALIGGLFASVYPNYLGYLEFFSLRAFTGLLHHSMMVFLVLLMLLTGYFTPSIKRWWVPFITYALFVVFGLFEIQVFGHPQDTMSIFEPLISGSPVMAVLTSWYMLGIGVGLAVVIFLILFEHFKNHKDFKSIFKEMINK